MALNKEIMTRTELINYIIKKQGYKTYLEIGIGTGKNFAAIKCATKFSVDPDNTGKPNFLMTSDKFFSQNKQTFNIIFIDGLHHADQVRRDITNAWQCLTDSGCLVIHDTNPDREEITRVPRETKEWTGDVYKVVYQIDGTIDFTLQDDHGVTVMRKIGHITIDETSKVDWPTFDKYRKEILNLVTDKRAIQIIDSWKKVMPFSYPA